MKKAKKKISEIKIKGIIQKQKKNYLGPAARTRESEQREPLAEPAT